jgi:hypothetical protein
LSWMIGHWKSDSLIVVRKHGIFSFRFGNVGESSEAV